MYKSLHLERNVELVKFSQCYFVMVFYASHILCKFYILQQKEYCYQVVCFDYMFFTWKTLSQFNFWSHRVSISDKTQEFQSTIRLTYFLYNHDACWTHHLVSFLFLGDVWCCALDKNQSQPMRCCTRLYSMTTIILPPQA